MTARRLSQDLARLSAFLLGGFLFSPGVGNALDPGKTVHEYPLSTWRTTDGLPQDTVRAMTQTADGYLWIGTQAGLARFDGVAFTVFGRRTHPEIFRNQHVYALAVSPPDTLWIGTNGGGLIRFEDGVFRLYTEDDGLPAGRITALQPGVAGELWIGTYGGGVARLTGERFDVFGAVQGLRHNVVFDLAVDAVGDLWVATYGGGVQRLREGRFDALTTAEGLPDDGTWAVLPSASGDLWVGTDKGLARLAGGRLVGTEIEVLTTADGLPHDRAIALVEDGDANLWIGTYGGGLARWSGGRLTHLDRLGGLPSEVIWSLFEDRDGILWVGTMGGGLSRLKNGSFATYGVAEGFEQSLISALSEDQDGVLWISTRNGLTRFDGHRFESPDGLPPVGVWGAEVDPAGNLWVATAGMGLAQRDGDRWRFFTTADGLGADIVFGVMAGRNGEVWAGTNCGLSRWDGDRFQTYTVADGLGSDQVRSFFVDRRGDFWVGTTGGLSRFDDGRFTTWTEADGLSSNNVWTIVEDQEGRLWIGTYGGGLNRFDDGLITAWTTVDGLPDDDVTVVLDDFAGHFWLGSSRGLARVAKKDLEAQATDRTRSLRVVAYDWHDGIHTESGGHPVGLRARDGRLWFSHRGGLLAVDPQDLEPAPAPQVVLERVMVDGELLSDELAPLRSDSQGFEFHFSAPTLLVPDKIFFRYRLEGFDDTWIEAEGRVAKYSFLKPGTYTFAVTASDEHGRWNGSVTRYRFEIAPPFHQTVWAFLLYGVVAAVLVGGVVAVQRRKIRREREINDRLREVDRLKDKLIATTSHELRTPLYGMTGLAESLLRGARGVLSETVRKDLELLVDRGRRLAELINSMLDFSRLGQKTSELVSKAASVVDEASEASPEASDQGLAAKILVVDDEPINRLILHQQLTGAGFAVREAESGPKALDLLNEEGADLVLLDIMMPEMPGFEVCRRLRQRFSVSELPVIFISAKSQPEDRIEGFRVGGNDYLVKPIDFEELQVRLDLQLQLRRSLRRSS